MMCSLVCVSCTWLLILLCPYPTCTWIDTAFSYTIFHICKGTCHWNAWNTASHRLTRSYWRTLSVGQVRNITPFYSKCPMLSPSRLAVTLHQNLSKRYASHNLREQKLGIFQSFMWVKLLRRFSKQLWDRNPAMQNLEMGSCAASTKRQLNFNYWTGDFHPANRCTSNQAKWLDWMHGLWKQWPKKS